jgi:hypothetical protein
MGRVDFEPEAVTFTPSAKRKFLSKSLCPRLGGISIAIDQEQNAELMS